MDKTTQTLFTDCGASSDVRTQELEGLTNDLDPANHQKKIIFFSWADHDEIVSKLE